MFLAIEELFYLFQLFLSGDFPLSIEKLDQMGVSQGMSLFTIPLGTSLNKSGSAVLFSVGLT